MFSRRDDTSVPPELYEAPHWYACLTTARAEKKAAELLDQAGFEHYLPLVVQERRWSDRVKKVPMPLFPGYVFARFVLTDLGRILDQPAIATVARPSGYPTPIRDDVIESVRRMVEGANETGVLPRAEDYLTVGDDVEVGDGPFTGMTGVLLEERGSTRVAVRIGALKQATSVEIAREHVRKVPSDGR